MHPPHRSASLPIPALLAALAAACGGDAPPATGAREGARRPNVLLVTLDTTRPDRLGCYGYEGAHTPSIDALAAGAVRFDRAVSTAGLTPMAHGSILTGLDPQRHGLRTFWGPGSDLSPDVPTLAEVLSEEGWDTAAFVSSYPLKPGYGFQRGFDHYDTGLPDEDDKTVRPEHAGILWVDGPSIDTQRRADATTDAALAWLERRGGERPWLCWVHYFDVHDYSLVPPEAWSREHGVDYADEVSRNDPGAREHLYDLEMRYMDGQLGRLFEHLAARGLEDDTLVVLTADHGQGLSDGLRLHGWGKHRLVYEWSVRVPLLVRAPGLAGAVARVEDLVRVTDVLPTVLELCGLDVPPGLDGRSLLPLLRGEPSAPRLAYSESLNVLGDEPPMKALPPHCKDNLFALQDGRWKLIFHANEPANTELYDLAADPGEQVNLAGERLDEVRRLMAELERSGALDLSRLGGPGPDELERARLRELGYVDDDEDAAPGAGGGR